MSRWLVLVLVLSTTMGRSVWGAYAAFDDVQISTPSWLQLSGTGAPPLIYRISRQAAGQALVELRSTAGAVDLRWCLADYQRDPTPCSTHIPVGVTVSVLVPLSRIDQGLYRLRLAYAVGDEEPRVLLSAAGAATAAAVEPAGAYRPTVAGVTVAFRSESLAYTISLRDGMADLHVRNFSPEAIHCDVTLAGWQDPTREHNPRLHLLPGSTTEVLIPLKNPDARVARAVVEVWNIRIGADDRGNLLIANPQFADHLLPLDGWFPVGMVGAMENATDFNPRVITWQMVGERLRLRNASGSRITAMAHINVGGELTQVPLTLPPEVITDVAATFAFDGRRPFVGLDQVVVDDQPVRRAIPVTAAAAVPEQALSVTARHVDERFNPLTLAYVLERAGAGKARLTVINRSAIAVHADVIIAGYQLAEVNNPRLHLPAGQQVVVELPVTRSDARLAIARLMVENVRLGDDLGELLVSAK